MLGPIPRPLRFQLSRVALAVAFLSPRAALADEPLVACDGPAGPDGSCAPSRRSAAPGSFDEADLWLDASDPWNSLDPALLPRDLVVGPPPSPDAGECLLFPTAPCHYTPVVELGMGWGTSRSYVGAQWSYHGFVESGLLVALGDGFALGPLVEAGFDLGGVTNGWTVTPKLRLRYWIDEGDFTLELAAGAAFERFGFNGGWELGTRVGGAVDAAATYMGVLGPYFSVSGLGDPGGDGLGEIRALAGFRANLVAWGVVVGAIGKAASGGF